MNRRAQWEGWQDIEGNACTPHTCAWDRLLMGLIGVPLTQTCQPLMRLTYGIMRQNSIWISSLGHLYPFDRWRKSLRSQTTWYWLYSAISTSWRQFIALHRKNMLRRHRLNFIFGKTKLKPGFPVLVSWVSAFPFFRKCFLPDFFSISVLCLYFKKIDYNDWLSFTHPPLPAESSVKMHVLIQEIGGGASNSQFASKSWMVLIVLGRRPHTLGGSAPAIALAKLNSKRFKPLQRTSSVQDSYLPVLARILGWVTDFNLYFLSLPDSTCSLPAYLAFWTESPLTYFWSIAHTSSLAPSVSRWRLSNSAFSLLASAGYQLILSACGQAHLIMSTPARRKRSELPSWLLGPVVPFELWRKQPE